MEELKILQKTEHLHEGRWWEAEFSLANLVSSRDFHSGPWGLHADYASIYQTASVEP